MSAWIETSKELPVCRHEYEQFDNSGNDCVFHGYVSDSVEISDGFNMARGHLRDDGVWSVYQSEHDCFNVKPDAVCYWMPMPEPPAL